MVALEAQCPEATTAVATAVASAGSAGSSCGVSAQETRQRERTGGARELIECEVEVLEVGEPVWDRSKTAAA